MSSYEIALKTWGAKRLAAVNKLQMDEIIDTDTVKVAMNFNEGFSCCGGSNPDCWCSYAESPTADVMITGEKVHETKLGRRFSVYCRIDYDDFDFATVLKEIVLAGDGIITE